jgi:hypothetical protein
VDKGKIGIKVADGSFYPILDEGVAQKKRLVLTTVKDDQESVQIDLYKGSGEGMEDAAYVGSLLVENITPDTQGNAEIELIVGLDEEGNLETVAEDRQSGSKQSLSVGLQNLDESGLYEVPDFSFEEEDTGVEDIFGEESDFTEVKSEDLTEPEFEPEFETDFEEDFASDFDTEELDVEDPGLEEAGFAEPGEAEAAEEFGDFDEELDSFGEAAGEPAAEIGEEVGEEAGEEDFFPAEEPFEEPFEESEEEIEEESEEESRSKVRPVLVALLVILALGLIGALLYLFVFMAADEEPAPQLQTQQEQEQKQTAAEAAEQEAAEEPAGAEEPAQSEQPAAETPTAETQPAPGEGAAEGEAAVSPSRDQVEFTGGVWYKIRWGDTLWEISSSFYDNPWLYDQIAEENEIRNPDVIYAENSIFVPKTQ